MEKLHVEMQHHLFIIYFFVTMEKVNVYMPIYYIEHTLVTKEMSLSHSYQYGLP